MHFSGEFLCFEKPGQHEWSHTLPHLSPLVRTKNPIEFTIEWGRQSPQHVEVATPYHGDLKITRTALSPRSPKGADGPLGRITQPHRSVNDNVIEMTITI